MLQLAGVSKSFGQHVAVQDVSFQVAQGSVFGLLGINGAGKTTTMRMILRILEPDRGEITWAGKPVTDKVRDRMGYLPEERGLYPGMVVLDQLVYLAQLKGISGADARKRAKDWLESLGIAQHAAVKLDSLSKGNQQKIQFIASVIHDPELLVVDEPFSGLDPVNTEVLRQAFLNVQKRGTTIILSSHRMEQVEQLCSAVCMINRGHVVMAGDLAQIRQQAPTRLLRIAASDLSFLPDIRGARVMRETPNAVELDVPADVDSQSILQVAMAHGRVTCFEWVEPHLHDIFLAKVGAAE